MPKRPCSRSCRATSWPWWLMRISVAPTAAATRRPGERDRDRVAVLANGHQRLAVDAHRRDLGAVERSGLGQRAQQRAFVGELVGDRRRPALDAPREVLLAGVTQHHVQLRHRPDRRNRNEMVAPEAPDLALDAALLVRALQADGRELRA